MNEKMLFKCIQEIFPKKKIKENILNLKIGSFKEWDSLAHLNLLLAIEKKFKFKFTMEQMYEVKSIREIKNIIKSQKK